MSLIAIGVALLLTITAIWLGWSLVLWALGIAGKGDSYALVSTRRTFPEALRHTVTFAKPVFFGAGIILALLLLFFLIIAGWTWAFGGRII